MPRQSGIHKYPGLKFQQRGMRYKSRPAFKFRGQCQANLMFIQTFGSLTIQVKIIFALRTLDISFKMKSYQIQRLQQTFYLTFLYQCLGCLQYVFGMVTQVIDIFVSLPPRNTTNKTQVFDSYPLHLQLCSSSLPSLKLLVIYTLCTFSSF